MFGSKKHRRRADDLAERLDTALQAVEQHKADLETARFNERTAIRARERAEKITANQRGELAKRAATILRLRETNTKLEQRLADLQEANESAYADLAARAGTIPAPAADDEADTAALIGGAR